MLEPCLKATRSLVAGRRWDTCGNGRRPPSTHTLGSSLTTPAARTAARGSGIGRWPRGVAGRRQVPLYVLATGIASGPTWMLFSRDFEPRNRFDAKHVQCLLFLLQCLLFYFPDAHLVVCAPGRGFSRRDGNRVSIYLSSWV